jgi:APA family basic amino acid/polyamine antiporter
MAIAIGAIMLFYGVNLIGLKMSSKTQNLLMAVKIFMLLLLVAALFWPTNYAENNVPIMTKVEGDWMDIISSFGLALIAVSFTYGGYQQTINFGSEVKDAPRTIPRAIFIGIAAIITLYLLVNVAYYNIIGFQGLQDKENRQIASLVVGKMFGQQGADAFSLLLFLSVLAYVNVTLLSNPRVMFAMSEDGILPAVFQKRSVKRGVYYVALTVFAAIAMVVVFFAETFDKILSFSIFLDSFGMALSAATIFIFRKRTRHLDNKGIYKMKLYPLMPIVFILAYLFVSISIAFNTPDIALIGTAVLVGFSLLYFLIRRKEPKEI